MYGQAEAATRISYLPHHKSNLKIGSIGKSILKGRMYLTDNQGKLIIKKLFSSIKKNPRKFLSNEQLSADKYRAISDFISGMTDRYAINLHNKIK